MLHTVRTSPRLFKLRLLSALLPALLACTSLHAELSSEHQEKLQLARRLDNYGYHQSALHYYKMVERNASLNEQERKDLVQEITAVEKKMATKKISPADANLPELDDFPQIKISESFKAKTHADAPLDPREFPATRINKKKWILSSLAIIGVSIIAYKVNKQMHKKPGNQIEVTF